MLDLRFLDALNRLPAEAVPVSGWGCAQLFPKSGFSEADIVNRGIARRCALLDRALEPRDLERLQGAAPAVPPIRIIRMTR
jgi:hypothetical protein